MSIRKFTRNRGWWRLFIVFAGLWYAGWLIGGGVLVYEEVVTAEKWPGTPLESSNEQTGYPDDYSLGELAIALWMANAKDDNEAAKTFARLYESKRDGTRPNNVPYGFVLDADLRHLEKYLPRSKYGGIPVNPSGLTKEELQAARDQALEAGEFEHALLIEQEIKAQNGVKNQPTNQTPSKPSRMEDFLAAIAGVAAIILFPWLIFVSFRALRWIVEGFTESEA